MKKTIRKKLDLKKQTVRVLTTQDLTLVEGGACRHASKNTQVPPPGSGRDTSPTC